VSPSRFPERARLTTATSGMLSIICGSETFVGVSLRGYTIVKFNLSSWLWKRSRALHATVIVAPLNLQVGENEVYQTFKPVLEELAVEKWPEEDDHDNEDGTGETDNRATDDGADKDSRAQPG